MRRVLHVDMDAFFAALEQRRRPELRGLPVVVGGEGDPTKRGVVSTASYEARRFGIHSAMPLRRARRRCPDAVFLPVDMPHYVEVSRRIKAILREFGDRVEDWGIDEAYLELAPEAPPADEVARDIKRRIREETGLTCSIGIGPNKLLAKIASDLEKPDGLTALGESDVGSRVAALPVRTLHGVGPKAAAALRELGVETIGELAGLPLDALVKRFGESRGRWLHDASHGRDDRPLELGGRRKSLGRETTFQQDVAERSELERTLADLVERVAGELRAQGLRAGSVTLKLRVVPFETHTRGAKLAEPTHDPELLRATALRCLERFDLSRKVRLLGFRVGALQPAAA